MTEESRKVPRGIYPARTRKCRRCGFKGAASYFWHSIDPAHEGWYCKDDDGCIQDGRQTVCVCGEMLRWSSKVRRWFHADPNHDPFKPPIHAPENANTYGVAP